MKHCEFEPFAWQELGEKPVIGVDEVGRGCLAGPVYSAAAIVPAQAVALLEAAGVTDSKKISEKRRPELAALIREHAVVGVGSASSDEIDQINILQATFLSMRRALAKLEVEWLARGGAPFGPGAGHLLVDGNQKIPMRAPGLQVLHGDSFIGRNIAQTTVIKGDLRALPIAAASIVAKVARDQLMAELAKEHPGYGFEKHKGYAAETHRAAIAELGPTAIHRKSFGGVREFVRL